MVHSEAPQTQNARNISIYLSCIYICCIHIINIYFIIFLIRRLRREQQVKKEECEVKWTE